jgi:hypothetical protein
MEGIQSTNLEVMPLPDSVFWYTLCILLFSFAAWVVKRHIDTNKETFQRHGDLITKMGECIVELTTMTKVHENQMQSVLKILDKHGDEIEALRDFYIVTYKK